MLISAWCLRVDVDSWLACLSDVCYLCLTLFVVSRVRFVVCCSLWSVACWLCLASVVCRLLLAVGHCLLIYA